METPRLLLGDCVEVMRAMPANSIDAIVTDPPYGLGFMGKEFDKLGDGPSQAAWHLRWTVEALRVLKPSGRLIAFGGTRTYHRLACAVEDAGFVLQDCVSWFHGTGFPKAKSQLKPAHEPAVLARKAGPVADLAIDLCRVGFSKRVPGSLSKNRKGIGNTGIGVGDGRSPGNQADIGRHPANIILDESAGVLLDEQSEGASRFFYCPKASMRERGEGNTHPTVKPVALMRYLARLIAPPGGLVLDPFAGSGTTGVACKAEGFGFVGIEKDPDYFKIALTRVSSGAQPH